MLLQHVYKPLLNFFYDKITNKIPENVRGYIITLCFTAIFAIQFISQYVYDFQGFNRNIRDVLICGFLGLVILISVNKTLEILKWRKSIYIPYTIAGILIFIAGRDHVLGPAYVAFPLTMVVGFMCLFYVWGNRGDYANLFRYASRAYLLYITVLLAICIVQYPLEVYHYTPMDYCPFHINPNGVSKLFLPGTACALYLSIDAAKTYKKVLFNVLAGCFTAVVILTNCRAGLLITPIMFAIYVVAEYYDADEMKQKLKNIGKGLAVALIAVILCQFVIKDVSMVIYENTTAFAETTVEATELGDSDSGDAEEEGQDEQGEPVKKSKAERRAERFATLGDRISGHPILSKLDALMAGRISIWTVYFDNMSWRGGGEHLFVSTEYAHNQYIELSYKAGIPVGILYLAWVVFTGVYLVKNFFKGGQKKKVLYFQLLIYPIFFITSMLDTGIIPYERGFIFLFYILSAPFFLMNDYTEVEVE